MRKALPSTEFFLLAAAFVLLGVLSFRIERALYAQDPRAVSVDAMLRFFGSAKEAIGDTLFLKADSYFHGGSKEHFDEDEVTLATQGHVDHGKDHAPGPLPADPIAWINEQVQTHEHYHLESGQRKEMLPLLAWSTDLDPHNVEALLTSAYWLDAEFGKTAEAVRLLERGTRDNPESCELYAAIADLYFKREKDFQKSSRYYELAISRIRTDTSAHSVGHIFYHLAQSYEELGRTREALLAYRRAEAVYRHQEKQVALLRTIGEKIRRLSSKG